MMIGAAQRYRDLLIELVLRRELSGGVLAPFEEARFVAELDRCWNAMTGEEQEAMERSLADRGPTEAPEALASADSRIEPGAR